VPALFAVSHDLEGVAHTLEGFTLSRVVLEKVPAWGTECDRSATRGAEKVIVVRLPDRLLVVRLLFGLFRLADNALLDQEGKGPITRGPGDLRPRGSEALMERNRHKTVLDCADDTLYAV